MNYRPNRRNCYSKVLKNHSHFVYKRKELSSWRNGFLAKGILVDMCDHRTRKQEQEYRSLVLTFEDFISPLCVANWRAELSRYGSDRVWGVLTVECATCWRWNQPRICTSCEPTLHFELHHDTSHTRFTSQHTKHPEPPLRSLCSNYQHIPLCCPLLHSTVTTIQTALLHWNPRQRWTTSAPAYSLRPVQPVLLSSHKEKKVKAGCGGE
jgi:hypothetical protein